LAGAVRADYRGNLARRQQRADLVEHLLSVLWIAETHSAQGDAGLQCAGSWRSLTSRGRRDRRPGTIEKRKQVPQVQQQLVQKRERSRELGEPVLNQDHGIQIERHVAEREPACTRL